MSRKKLFINLIVVLGFTLITLKYLLDGKDLEGVLKYIGEADWRYWIFAIGLVIVFILSESVVIYILTKSLGQKVKLPHCFIYSFVGFFFSLITPSATGGQPVQAVFMKKDQIPYHISSLVLMVVTVVYKMVLIFFGAVVLIFRPHAVMRLIEPVMGWVIVGMALNVVVVSFMLALIFVPKLTSSIVNGVLKLVAKIFKGERVAKVQNRFNNSMAKYSKASRYFATKKKVLAKVIGITFFQRLCYFFITYVVILSFGMRCNFLLIITLQAIISMAVDMMPLPGGIGISESLFTRIFSPILGVQLCTPILMVTRGISFYSQLIISAIFTVIGYFIFLGRNEDDRIL